jgi:CrcB protein
LWLRRVESGKQVRVILLLAFFGALGTMARYGLEGWIHHWTGAAFPAGTLAVNLAGCLLLGAGGRYAFNHIAFPPELRTSITIGFCGAFTTFSTFSWETVRMLQEGEWMKAGLYVVVSVAGGLVAAATGMRLGNAL